VLLVLLEEVLLRVLLSSRFYLHLVVLILLLLPALIKVFLAHALETKLADGEVAGLFVTRVLEFEDTFRRKAEPLSLVSS
jgi:hypothetical protein